MESRRLLVVGCGFPQLGLIRFAKEQGLTVVGLDANPRAVGVALCDAFVEASTTDVDAICGAGADGITTCGSEHALLPTAEACARLGLPFYSPPERIRTCQEKQHMRAALDGTGVSPSWREVHAVDEAAAFVAEQGLPVVCKPAFGWGQRGVSVVKEPAELTPAVERALAASVRGGALIEGFIEGREVSVDAYTVGGDTDVLAVTERIITGYPDPPGITFAEVHPSGLTAAELDAIIAAAKVANAALGIDRGPTYTQMRVGPAGAFVVEVAHRLGGGLDPEVAFLASGKSLYRRIVGVALGEDAWERMGPEGAAHGGAIGHFIIGKPGVVSRVDGLDSARAMAGIVAAEVYVGPGDRVHPLTDGSKRAGHVVAVGADRAEATARAKTAAAAIDIVTS